MDDLERFAQIKIFQERFEETLRKHPETYEALFSILSGLLIEKEEKEIE
jgi:hypothetical protein